MKLIGPQTEQLIDSNIIQYLRQKQYDKAAENIAEVLEDLYKAIPEHKRISYGSVHTIKELAKHLNDRFGDQDHYREHCYKLFKVCDEGRSKGVALGMISFFGTIDPGRVLNVFEEAAASDSWELREHAQMFVKKLIKKYPEKMQVYMIRLAKSPDHNVRRFVAESMRPVQENRWFQKQTDYSLKVVELLFKENHPYPRSAVGNNLSDLARQNPELILGIVKKLMKSKNQNSIWIAHRACRNLIKKYPLEVFDALQTDFYKYKTTTYKRSDYQGS